MLQREEVLEMENLGAAAAAGAVAVRSLDQLADHADALTAEQEAALRRLRTQQVPPRRQTRVAGHTTLYHQASRPSARNQKPADHAEKRRAARKSQKAARKSQRGKR